MSPLPISFFIPMQVPSLSNLREHWNVRRRRAATQRQYAKAHLRAQGVPLELPVEVILSRVSPRPLDDDNLRGALKSTRDGIADELGVDDRDPRVTWRYEQERGKPKEHGVRVTIGEVSALCPTCGQKRSAA